MNWKTPVTMLVLLGILLGAAYYGWSTIIAPDDQKNNVVTQPSEKKKDHRCTRVKRFKKGQAVKAQTIRVNVYNAGLISGLAAETLDALASKGFKPGIASNAPGNMSAGNVTILTAEPESPEVRLVRIQFRGPVQVKKGELAPGIDVLVGDGFRAVDPAVRTEITLRKNISACKRANS
ncbi:MAG: LytR C-terminal domain-containing protein [Nocardioidaceae bacterium]|nr:LytR C-terminal domain-containing protein [Nocardioidaceae bacterium]